MLRKISLVIAVLAWGLNSQAKSTKDFIVKKHRVKTSNQVKRIQNLKLKKLNSRKAKLIEGLYAIYEGSQLMVGVHIRNITKSRVQSNTFNFLYDTYDSDNLQDLFNQGPTYSGLIGSVVNNIIMFEDPLDMAQNGYRFPLKKLSKKGLQSISGWNTYAAIGECDFDNLLNPKSSNFDFAALCDFSPRNEVQTIINTAGMVRIEI